MALISLMGKDCSRQVRARRGLHAPTAQASSPASPCPRLDLQPHSTWLGQRGVGDPAEAYASWEGCSSSTTPRDSPAQAEFTAPLGTPEMWLWEGASCEQPLPFLGPWAPPWQGTENRHKPWLNLPCVFSTLRHHRPTLHPHSASRAGSLSSGEWFTGSCFVNPNPSGVPKAKPA